MSTGLRFPTMWLLPALLAGQAPPADIRITVTLIQVDAVVTDSKGRRVPGLRPEDFEILQDGEAQRITHFAYVPEHPPIARDQAPIGSAPPVSASEVKRTVALVVDDLALSFANLVRVRESLRKYVDQQMKSGDLVAIVRTGGGVAILEQFTTDKRVLLESIDLLKWRFTGRAGLLPINAIDGGSGARADAPQAEPQILDYGVSLSALGALGAIEQVVRGMKGLPGRKSVVFLSDGLNMDPRVNTAIDRLTDLANRSAVSLYTIDPGGLRPHAPSAAENIDISGSSTGSILGSIAAVQSEEVFWSQEGLDYLAKRTGGLFFSNNNDIPGCIRQATDDQFGYYLLGYSPREGTFEKNKQKAKFHRVLVRVKRPGLQVRWKTGFTGLADEVPETEPSAKTREEQLLDALASPFKATGLKIRLTSLYLNTAKSGPNIRSMLHFDAKDLTFTQDGDGSWRAAVDIVTSAYRGVKQPIEQRQRVEEIRLPDELHRRALKEGFLYLMDHPMKQAGTFLMRVVVRDTASERIGSASQFVQAPETRKGQFALSSVWTKLAPPELTERTGADSGVAGPDGKVEPWVEGGPAVRRYRPGQRIVYGFIVINPKLKGSMKKSDVLVEVRVFRNGKLFFTGKPTDLSEDGRRDDKHYIGGGLLRLGKTLTPGEYLLQVIVTDRLANKKKSQSAQWIDFEVTAAPPS